MSTKQTNFQVVVQHNNLVNARYEMELLEMKIFLAMLSQIKKEDEQLQEYHIPVNWFYESPNGSAYQNIKKAGDALTKKNISVEDINRKKFASFALMRYCIYEHGSGYIRVRFNDDVQPYLIQLKGNFTISSLKYLWRLNSVHSVRIYNLLRERKDFGGRTESVDDLKSVLGVGKKYSDLSNLKRCVLNVAQEELKATDLSFDYELLRTGRKITHIKFTITSQPETVQLDLFKTESEEQNEFTSRAFKVLKGWEFSKIQINKIMQADHQQICKVSYAMKMEKPTGINVTGWAYNEFLKRLGLSKY